MRQYRPDEYPPRVEVNRGNQAQPVPADVEHEQTAHLVRAGKKFAQLRKIPPLGLLAQAIPLIQRTGTLWMHFLCCDNTAMGDNVHRFIISQKEIYGDGLC